MCANRRGRFAARLLSLLPAVVALAHAPHAFADPYVPAGQRTRNVAIVLYNGVELLDFAGPGEVFEAATHRGMHGLPAFNTYTVALTTDPVVSQRFVTVTPQFSIDDCPAPDILVIPGGSGELMRDPRMVAWMRRVAPESEIAFSVCTGAFAFAHLGLLDGVEATTHWSAIEALRQRAPKATIVENRRFVDAGRVVTAAGVSAGIDGSLHVVARLLGRRAAADTARYMEYEWRPGEEQLAAYDDYPSGIDAHGRAEYDANEAVQSGNWTLAAELYAKITEEYPDDGHAWQMLGLAQIRTDQFDEARRSLRHATETFPETRAYNLYNLACVESRLGNLDAAMEALTGAIEGGFEQSHLIHTDTDLDPLRDDPRFKALVEKVKASPGAQ